MDAQELENLKQRDLSHLTVQQMNAAERTELCRRYVAFIAHFGGPSPAPPAKREVRKWVPGERGPQ